MIDYEPFWQTLENSEDNWYTLVHKHGINPATLHRLKHNKPISTVTIDVFCKILHCEVNNIIRYIPDEKASEN
jgi:DNA-binding Xre family transcriptional regulator